ncbi:MAG: ABC-F family ATP-binding cassette domain-containing protein [Proteobacteria bacterium]|nr:ABC-F family ATP-binding cassette domain-containing protein [Pseudomonadota bacterium]
MAADPPILTLKNAAVGFGGTPLFTGAELSVTPGMRACLVGRNGTGKSTILKLLAGLIEPDEGTLYIQPGLTVGYLPQDMPLPADMLIEDFVTGMGAKLGMSADTAPRHAVDAALSRVDIDGMRNVNSLSGGESRRVAIAGALLGDPDVLLLDEPTNHLDLPTIEWLERELVDRRKTLITISHDRAFLEAMTTDTFWLHRGAVRHNAEGYSKFETWTEQVADAEVRAAQKLDQKLKAEARWLERGVTARRRRNQGRLTKLEGMRAQRKALLTGQDLVQLEADAGPISSRLVVECENLCKAFGDDVIIDNFSTRILRGDRVGLVGPNGAGKTTLLKLLIGELEKDSGRLRRAKNTALAFFDQTREQLNPSDTLWETLAPQGGDSINVRGTQRHVVAYLRDFLFDEKQARAPVATLSGGERNRLLLAKILAQTSNLLVLDEPTNDLDADTLDVLLDMLDSYEGTVLLVSHDRDFLDRVVNSTIAVEGGGHVMEYPGGYSDYLRQRKRVAKSAAKPAKKTGTGKPARTKADKSGRMTFKDEHELGALPDRIKALDNARAELEKALSDPNLFVRDAAAYETAAKKLVEVEAAITSAEDRWLDLETRRESLDAAR